MSAQIFDIEVARRRRAWRRGLTVAAVAMALLALWVIANNKQQPEVS